MMTAIFIVMVIVSFILGYLVANKLCYSFMVKYLTLFINDLYVRQGLDYSYIRKAVQSCNNYYGSEIISLRKQDEEQ